MRLKVLAVCLVPAAFVAAAAFVACGGTSVSGNTNPLASREPPGSSYENPNGGEEPAQSTDEPPGTTNGGTNGTIPLCQNPTEDITSCEQCIGSSCGASLSPAIASCSAFLTCIRNCACSDATCLGNCVTPTNLTSACDTAATPLGQCIQSSCSTQCNDIPISLGGDGGTTSVTTSTGGGGGTVSGSDSCTQLAGCCSAFPSGEASACEATATAGVESACADEVSGLQAENLCN